MVHLCPDLDAEDRAIPLATAETGLYQTTGTAYIVFRREITLLGLLEMTPWREQQPTKDKHTTTKEKRAIVPADLQLYMVETKLDSVEA